MLVLSRKLNEEIVLNRNIVVKVVDIRGDKVRIGLIAPADVSIYRREIYDIVHDVEAPVTGSVHRINVPSDTGPVLILAEAYPQDACGSVLVREITEDGTPTGVTAVLPTAEFWQAVAR